MKKIVTLFVLLSGAVCSYAQMTGWSTSRTIQVAEHTGSDLLNYQLKLTLDTQTPITAGEMLTDGADIRFTETCTGGVSFDYWIESGINTSSTIIWVEIDTLRANATRTIYLQYGNTSATPVSAIATTFQGPHSSTDSVSSGAPGGVGDSQRGFRFYPNEDVLVTAFGKREPTGTDRIITLFDNATQAILLQHTVPGPAAQYSYSNLPAPLWLTQGTQYLLEMYQNATDGYYFGTSSQIGSHLTYLDMRYCNGCDQNTFPQNYLNQIHYGTPDFWYYSKTNAAIAPTYELDSAFRLGLTAATVCQFDTTQIMLQQLGGTAPFTYTWTGANIADNTVASPYIGIQAPGSYYVTVADVCGYGRTDTIDVAMHNLPVLIVQASDSLICDGESAILSVTGTTNYAWENASTNDSLVVSPSVSTWYSVTGTDLNLCSTIDSLEIAVNIPLTETFDVMICTGQSYNVDDHSYSVSGTYIDTLAGITSCDSIVTTNLIVRPLGQGSQTIELCYLTSYTIGQHTYTQNGVYIDTIPGSVVCDSIVTTTIVELDEIDSEFQLVGTTFVADFGGDTYTWIDCATNTAIPGATTSVFEPVANGNYAVIVGIGNCADTSDCIELDFLALSEFDLIENMAVHPNPNNGTFSIQSSTTQTVSVIDALGHVISTIGLIAGTAQQVELKSLTPGMYFVKSRTKVVRLIIE